MAIENRFEQTDSTRTSSEVSSHSRSLLIFGLTIAAFTLAALWLAVKLNLYIDELYSLHTTSRGFGYALEQSLGFEQQPPLYFLLLTAWRTLSGSDFFARLFSIFCSVATLFTTYWFARRRLTSIPAWVAPFALAVNPFFLWAALDIRVYALIVLISTILIATFFDAFIDDGTSLPKIAAFTVAAIAALYTQYFIGSLFLGFGLTLLIAGPRRKFGPFVLSMLVVILACLPLLGILHNELHDATVVNAVRPLTILGRMFTATISFVYPHAWYATASKLFKYPYIALVLGTLVLIAVELRRSVTLQRLVTIDACIVAFFALVILVARAPLEMPRHISTLFVPLTLLVLAAFAAVRDARPRLRLIGAFVISVALCSAVDETLAFPLPLAKVGDWQRVGNLLNARVREGEPIAVFDTEDALGVRHYYRGTSRVVPLPGEQSFVVFDRRDFAIRDSAVLAAVFPAASRTTGRVWLVFGVSTCTIVEFGPSCAILNSYLDAHFRTLEEHKFDGTVVRELQAK